MKTLNDVKIGETAIVAKLNGQGALRRRIMDMGITKGTPIYLRKVARLETRLKSPFVDTNYLYGGKMPKILSLIKKRGIIYVTDNRFNR